MLINAQNLDLLFASFSTAFNDGFAKAAPDWDKIATLVPSATKRNDYGWIGQLPSLRKWIGDRQVKNLAAHGYSVANEPYEMTIAVPRRDIESDQYGVFAPLFGEMGNSAGRHPDELVFDLLKAGFDTECYDGQPFFDLDHPVGNGVVGNMVDGGSAPWFLLDTSRMLKPLLFQRWKDYRFQRRDNADDDNVWKRNEYEYGTDADVSAGFGFWQMAYGSKAALDAPAFRAARAAMKALKGDTGASLGIRPTLLVVGPSNETAAREILIAERSANGATNLDRNTADLLVTPYLD